MANENEDTIETTGFRLVPEDEVEGTYKPEEIIEEEIIEEEIIKEEIIEEEEQPNDDESFLNSLNARTGTTFTSLDEFKESLTPKETRELPEYIEKYLEYEKTTGRTFDDYQRLGRDIKAIDQDELIKDWISQTTKGLDKEDVDFKFESQFLFDEEEDSESTIRNKKIEKKSAYTQALEFFEAQKEEYSRPIESMKSDLPEAVKEQLSKYNEISSQREQNEALDAEKSAYFMQKTDELFDNDFKGFEFKVGDKEQLLFEVEDAKKAKESQPGIAEVIGKYLDKDGKMKDAKGFHRALAIFADPEKFMRFAYEQGKTAGILEDETNAKNLDYKRDSGKKAAGSESGFRLVENDSDDRGIVKKRNRS